MPLENHGHEPLPPPTNLIGRHQKVSGLLKHADYQQGHAIVRPGDLLLLYSDGSVEAESASGEQFDEARLLDVLRDNWAERRRRFEMKCSRASTPFSTKGRPRMTSPWLSGGSRLCARMTIPKYPSGPA